MDLIVKNVQIYNSYFKKFIDADVWIKEGKIFYINEQKTDCPDIEKIVDGSGLYMVPGLIDIHMHIESSMMTPEVFCDHLVSCGVTTIVSEPHEMANVNGMNGILDMIQAGQSAPIDIFYGIPSCVPSTSEILETTGGIIGQAQMERLMEHPDIVCVGEVMNYRQIIQQNDLEIFKFIKDLKQKDRIFPVEGHCPSLIDLDLAKFLYLGINGDHTEHSIEELRQRFANGMFVEIQAKMLGKDVMDFIMMNHLEEHFCFVTDDVMADTLCEKGHLDALVRDAIALDMKPEQAIYNATYTAARRMNLLDRGVLAPGKLADFVLLDNLADFSVVSTYKRGVCVYDSRTPLSRTAKGRPAGDLPRESGLCSKFPDHYYHSIRLAKQTADCLELHCGLKDGIYDVRVMEICDGGTKTKEKIVKMEVKAGNLCWQESGCLLTAVFERYGKNGNIGFGFLCGDCHKQGAIATSYAHDSHNILVAGVNTDDMILVLNRLIELQGGMVVAHDGEIGAEIQLNVGGILSDQPAAEIGAALKKVRTAMENLGYHHYNPIMSICTVTLPVSPSLKLTDKGLIDVEKAAIVPLVISPINT